MADISGLPMLHHIDADYSPQYVKLASQYKVSVRVTCNALAMPAANRYVSRPGTFRSYSAIWQVGA